MFFIFDVLISINYYRVIDFSAVLTLLLLHNVWRLLHLYMAVFSVIIIKSKDIMNNGRRRKICNIKNFIIHACSLGIAKIICII